MPSIKTTGAQSLALFLGDKPSKMLSMVLEGFSVVWDFGRSKQALRFRLIAIKVLIDK